jgi:putative membrane protein insertion efficiency factor
MPKLRDFPKTLLKTLVHVYAYAISPLLGTNCRFHPTCSVYTQQALEAQGVIKGGFMALRRILKCHPWHKGPFLDPVPTAIDRAPGIGYKRAEHSKEE